MWRFCTLCFVALSLQVEQEQTEKLRLQDDLTQQLTKAQNEVGSILFIKTFQVL
jgi:hypothetical protein